MCLYRKYILKLLSGRTTGPEKLKYTQHNNIVQKEVLFLLLFFKKNIGPWGSERVMIGEMFFYTFS
jgi:hypothetical protein